MKVVAFWFRRDLRLEDNHGLSKALDSGFPVLPVFIFDTEILQELPKDDARVTFIYEQLGLLHNALRKRGSALLIRAGKPEQVWDQLFDEFELHSTYCNRDYEPYAIHRDALIRDKAESLGVQWHTYKDQVIFEPHEILKPANSEPYTIFTAYKRRWLERFNPQDVLVPLRMKDNNYHQFNSNFPSLDTFGFMPGKLTVKSFDLSCLDLYSTTRDTPAADHTSYLSVHLRFGTVSIREVLRMVDFVYEIFISELIWREFFMQILFHFPYVVNKSFKPKYDHIVWRNNLDEFERWKNGQTGYPLVDAGMHQLNQTGYMHNRVRMVTASFLCKHLLIDWRWGEAYFAQKLLDYELSSNNGNWQWVAGTGCDAAPFFRIFNPTTQQKKFDPKMEYTKKWVTEILSPIVDHKFARDRALNTYKAGIT